MYAIILLYMFCIRDDVVSVGLFDCIFSVVRRSVHVIVKLMFVAVGFHRVRIVGEQATRRQAPVLVVAPHSSFYDGLAAVVTGGPIIVAEQENSFMPVVGSTRDDDDDNYYYNTTFLIIIYIYIYSPFPFQFSYENSVRIALQSPVRMQFRSSRDCRTPAHVLYKRVLRKI